MNLNVLLAYICMYCSKMAWIWKRAPCRTTTLYACRVLLDKTWEDKATGAYILRVQMGTSTNLESCLLRVLPLGVTDHGPKCGVLPDSFSKMSSRTVP